MNMFDDGRIDTRNDRDYEIRISHGLFLVEHDDRLTPEVWRAYFDGVRLEDSDHPLAAAEELCADFISPIPMIKALLSYDERPAPEKADA